MSRILVMGAGLVARPLVRYLSAQPGFHVTVVDQDAAAAESLGALAESCEAVQASVSDPKKLGELVAAHDVVVSLLPAQLHPIIATACIAHGRHLVTASYVSPAVEALDHDARRKGLTFLNEVGVDPGLDHMSAMRVIHDIRRRGGNVRRFQSYCGGVPALEAADNPWRYKISWSPRGVCMAASSTARYARQGTVYTLSGAELFEDPDPIEIDGIATFEAYPNRDSLKYVELYELRHVTTMYRGTLRYEGWCETMRAAMKLELFEDDPVELPEGATLAQFMAERAGADPNEPLDGASVRRLVAERLGQAEDHPVLDRFEHLGLFSEELPGLSGEELTPLDVVASCMAKHLAYAPGERDMIVMKHFFVGRFEKRKVEEHITAALNAYGEPDGDSAMSRTVGLPAAVAAKLIAIGDVDWPGVHIPVVPQIYDPILDALAAENISFVETKYTEPL